MYQHWENKYKNVVVLAHSGGGVYVWLKKKVLLDVK